MPFEDDRKNAECKQIDTSHRAQSKDTTQISNRTERNRNREITQSNRE